LLIGLEKEKLVEEMKLFTAMRFYKMNILSLGKAAEFAGKNKDDFIESFSEQGIDVVKYSKEKLEEETKIVPFALLRYTLWVF